MLNNYISSTHKNILLPIKISQYFTCRTDFLTGVQDSVNGMECRIAKRTIGLNSYTIKDKIISREDFDQVKKIFCDVRGRLYSFLFLDAEEYSVLNAKIVKVANTYNLSVSVKGINKIIKTPVTQSIQVYKEGQKLDTKYNEKAGLLELDDTIDLNLVKVNFNFFTPVRLDQDVLDYEEYKSCVLIKHIKLREVIL